MKTHKRFGHARLGRGIALLLAALALATVVAVLGGCKSSLPEPTTSGAPAQTVPSLWNVVPAKLTQMTPAEKSSKIASGFPMQVPVPVGDLQRGDAQGQSAWDYVLVVPGSLESVMRWYMDAYLSAEWTVSSRSAKVLTLQKNDAQTQLRFETVAGSPAKTKVTASVGIGTPILQTQ